MASNLAQFWHWIKGPAGTVTVLKRAEITIETEQVLTIRRRRSIRCWCPECGREVEVVGLNDAELLTGMTQAMLSCGRGDGRWHWSQAEDGSPLLCLESLLKSR